jgi:hypothetical protein
MVRRIVVRNDQRRNKKKRPASQVDSEKQEKEDCAAFINRIRMNSFC